MCVAAVIIVADTLGPIVLALWGATLLYPFPIGFVIGWSLSKKNSRHESN
jgi:hypothetical protein